MKNALNTSPRLINDEPALEDGLGAHKRIANTLCEIVKSNNGGKTIALEGEWGAGKSTVINLMSHSLENSKDFKVVVYDAWVHSGDPLRRAFLNSIIDALIKKKWLADESHWNGIKEHLSRRVKNSTKTSSPIFTPFGQILLLLLLLLPLSGVVFSGLYMAQARNGFTDFTLLSATGISMAISGLIALLPFILVLLRAIYAWCTGIQTNDWALILNKSSVTENTSTIETPDPTTIEFQDVFEEIAKQSLSKIGRKLVLVIDNLDRLPNEEAEMVWSMLRSFIDNPAFKTSQWHEHLWVVVPVAQNGSLSNSTLGTDKDSTSKNGKFLEKVFQVKLALPPPVLADWKNYLICLLQRAFQDSENEHFPNIHRIFEAHIQETRSSGQFSPTPRELVIFTNELVTLKIQWADQFNISYLAAYILSSRNKDFLSALQAREIPSARTLRLLCTTDATKEFATIYFNVSDGNKAQQLLLRTIFEESLIKGDEKHLLENLMADKSCEHVVEGIISESLGNWANEIPEYFFNTLTALNHIENPSPGLKSNNEDASNTRKLNFTAEFVKYLGTQGVAAINSFEALPIAVENCATGISNYLEIVKESTVEKAIIEAIKRLSLIGSAKQSVLNQIIPTESNIENWLVRFKEITTHHRILTLLITEKSNSIRLPIPTELWGEFCREFENERKILSVFTPNIGINQIKTHIIEIEIKQTKFCWLDYYTIKREVELSNIEFLNSVSESLVPQVFAQQTLPSEFLEPILWTTINLSASHNAWKAKLIDIVNSGWLHHHLHALSLQQSNSCAAILVTGILLVNPKGTLPVVIGNGSAGNAILQKILSCSTDILPIANEFSILIDDLSLQRLLIEISISAPTSTALVAHAVQKLGDSEDVLSKIYQMFSMVDVDSFAIEVSAFANAAKTGTQTSEAIQREIILFCIQHRNLLSLLINDNAFNLINLWVYNFSLSQGGNSNKQFKDRCIEVLQNVNESDWNSNIASSGWVVKLTHDLLSYEANIKLGEPLRNTLLVLAKGTIKPDTSINIETEYLISLVNALEDVHKHSFADDVFGIVSQQGIIVSAQFWIKFGFAVTNAAVRLGSKGRTVRTVVKPMIARSDIAGLKWFSALLNEVGIKRIDDDEIAIKDLIEAAVSYLQQTNQNLEMTETLREISILLGFEERTSNPE